MDKASRPATPASNIWPREPFDDHSEANVLTKSSDASNDGVESTTRSSEPNRNDGGAVPREADKAGKPDGLAGEDLSIAPRDDHPFELEIGEEPEPPKDPLAPLRRIEQDAHGHDESVRPEGDQACKPDGLAGNPQSIARPLYI